MKNITKCKIFTDDKDYDCIQFRGYSNIYDVLKYNSKINIKITLNENKDKELFLILFDGDEIPVKIKDYIVFICDKFGDIAFVFVIEDKNIKIV